MVLDKVAGLVRQQTVRVSKVNVIAMVALMVMMLWMTTNVTGRYLFNAPIRGTTDAQEILMVLIIGAALADRALHGGHIALELLFDNLPPKPKAIWGSIISLVSFVFVSLLTVLTARYVWKAYDYQMASQVLKIPDFIPIAILTLGLAALALAFLSDFLDYLSNMSKAVKK
ncbi:TRAP transporter small permease [Chloroflexota bacterium]